MNFFGVSNVLFKIANKNSNGFSMLCTLLLVSYCVLRVFFIFIAFESFVLHHLVTSTHHNTKSLVQIYSNCNKIRQELKETKDFFKSLSLPFCDH